MKMRDGRRFFLSKKVFPVIFFIVLFLIVALGLLQEKQASIDGSSVFDIASVFDAAATQGVANISATIIDSSPLITITQPKNKTYENDRNVRISISVENLSLLPIATVFYNLDDLENITLVMDANNENETSFNVAEGSHTLKFFANNTANELNSSEVNFDLRESIRFQVNWSIFHASPTNLSAFNEKDLQNITNLTLEIPSFGSIQFKGFINLTDDNLIDDPIDLDSFVMINSSSIIINDTVFQNLHDIPATLSFYGVTFANPKVQRNGMDCPITICTSQTLAGTTLSVDVTGFSRYDLVDGSSSESGESTGSGSNGGSGGGGGGNKGGLPSSVTYDLREFTEQTQVMTRIGKIFVQWNGEEYGARIGKPSPDSVLFDFTVLGLRVTLGRGQSATIDLDFNGEPDIKLEVEDLGSSFITITAATLRKIELPTSSVEKTPEEPSKETAKKSIESAAKKGLFNKDFLGVIFLISLGIGFVGYMKMFNKQAVKKRRKHF